MRIRIPLEVRRPYTTFFQPSSARQENSVHQKDDNGPDLSKIAFEGE